MRRSFRILLMALLVALTGSCKLYDKIFGDEVAARLGSKTLPLSEVEGVVAPGTPSADSAILVQQFIHSWAQSSLLAEIAERQLPKDMKNLDREIEEFRRQMLVYRYENLYVQKHLDTVVSRRECMDYYEHNPESFVAANSFVKGRYIRISTSSPELKVVKSLYASYNANDSLRLEQVCYHSADLYWDFSQEWVPLERIAADIHSELSACEGRFAFASSLEKEHLGYTLLVSIRDRVAPGKQIPFEYCEEKIKDIIVSRRKQDLISALEREIYNKAVESNRLIIY